MSNKGSWLWKDFEAHCASVKESLETYTLLYECISDLILRKAPEALGVPQVKVDSASNKIKLLAIPADIIERD